MLDLTAYKIYYTDVSKISILLPQPKTPLLFRKPEAGYIAPW